MEITPKYVGKINNKMHDVVHLLVLIKAVSQRVLFGMAHVMVVVDAAARCH